MTATQVASMLQRTPAQVRGGAAGGSLAGRAAQPAGGALHCWPCSAAAAVALARCARLARPRAHAVLAPPAARRSRGRGGTASTSP